MTTTSTRRAVLAGAAALPALAIVPATALAAVDPIFAAIERQKVLWAEWSKIIVLEPPTKSPEFAAWESMNNAAADSYVEGFETLFQTKPITRAGAVALIEHCLAEDSGLFGSNDEDSNCNSRSPRTLCQTLATVIPALA